MKLTDLFSKRSMMLMITIITLIMVNIIVPSCEKPERIVKIASVDILDTDISYTTVTLKGEIVDLGSRKIEDHGIILSENSMPRVGNARVESLGPITSKGVFQVSVINLTKNTLYYFRAFVTINGIDINADKTYQFKTKDTQLASVSSVAIIDTTLTTSRASATVTSDGGETVSKRGFCWGTSTNPQIGSCLDTTINGSGTGIFNGQIHGLAAGTRYYVRAYTINIKGTSYNSADVILTTYDIPALTTIPLSSQTTTGAVSGGNITNPGGTTVTVRGVCWGTLPAPTISLSTKTSDGPGTGVFSSTITGLTPGTLYYIRAYATNKFGTGYGNEIQFTPPVPPTTTTAAATLVGNTTVTLNGTVNANNSSASVTFEYGTTTAYGTSVPGSPSPVTGNSLTTVSANLTGLLPGNLYHFRVRAINSGGTTDGSDQTFITLKGPDAITEDPTNITTNAAILNGKVNANNSSTSVSFEYGTTTTYGSTIAATPGTVTGNIITSVSASLTALSPGSIYHYRVKAISTGGTTYGEDKIINVLAPSMATTTAATSVANTTATLNGTLNANNLSTAVTFEYGTTTEYGSFAPATPSPVTGSILTTVSAGLTGLTAGTLYHFRIEGTSAAGPTYGNDLTFTTLQPPTAVSEAATLVGNTTVTLNGTINANNSSSIVTFEYGTTTAYGTSVTASQSPITGNNVTNVSADLTGLTPGATYHFKVKAISAGGTTDGGDLTFLTNSPPAVTADAPTTVTTRSAQLNGTVNPTGKSTTYYFQYGLTTSYGSNSTSTNAGTGTSVIPLNAAVDYLIADTTYHYRIVSTNSGGTAYSNDVSFRTGALSLSLSAPASDTTAVKGQIVKIKWSGSPSTASVSIRRDNDNVWENGTGETWLSLLQASSGTYLWNTTSVPAGTYYIAAMITDGNSSKYVYGPGKATISIPPTVTDFDGNVYYVVRIGTQDWMQSNLKTTHYNNGDLIPEVTDNTAWSGLTSGALAWYNNDASTYKVTYGALYNWFATVDIRNACPTGWHVPKDYEWTTLITFLGGESVAGGKLKESGTAHWATPNTDADNSSGFLSLPGGDRNGGVYIGLGQNGVWWTSTEDGSINGKLKQAYYNNSSINSSSHNKQSGFSVRCIKGVLPIAETSAITGLTSSSATLNAKINANSATANTSFEYGTTTSYGSTAAGPDVMGSVPATIGADIAGLLPGTTYHYRVKAVNSGGTSYGSDMTFTTPQPPAVTTGITGSITPNTAILIGTVNANNLTSTVTFEYGPTTSYGLTATADQSPVTGSSSTPVSTSLTGLTPSTTYHCRVKAVSSAGTSYGADGIFDTPAIPLTVTDYDGNVYNIVKIGTQDWMQSNLKVKNFNNGDPITLVEGLWTDASFPAYCNVQNDVSHFPNYGLLYNFFVAKDTRNACPIGWHVPSESDWEILKTELGGESVAGGKLKEIGLDNWLTPNTNASNSSGFTGLPGGYRYYTWWNYVWGPFMYHGDWGCFWEDKVPYARVLYASSEGLGRIYSDNKSGMSIRCVKGQLPLVETVTATGVASNSSILKGSVNPNGSTTSVSFEYGITSSYGSTVTAINNPVSGSVSTNLSADISGLNPGSAYHYRIKASNSTGTSYGSDMSFTAPSTLIDADGNVYNAVQIGTQIWMKENLKTTKYNDNSGITLVTDGTTWGGLTSGGYCWYDFDETANKNTYGALYNFYTIRTSKLCPIGWHVPHESEWNVLVNFLGGSNSAYLKLKESGTSHWPDPNIGTNESGFTSIPSGLGPVFIGIGKTQYSCAYYWTDDDMGSWSYFRSIDNNMTSIYANYLGIGNGLSVRCIKD